MSAETRPAAMPAPHHVVSPRGPAEHARREQIIDAASAHFRHYGYKKTTVGDLAKAIGLSTAYIYKFFESKRAIGEAICSLCLGKILVELRAIADAERPAAERLRSVFRTQARSSAELFFHERKLHDMVVAAHEERWGSVLKNEAALLAIIQRIVRDGREAGEFERKTPIGETCQAILSILLPFRHPVLLAQKLDSLDEDAATMADLVLRSLAR